MMQHALKLVVCSFMVTWLGCAGSRLPPEASVPSGPELFLTAGRAGTSRSYLGEGQPYCVLQPERFAGTALGAGIADELARQLVARGYHHVPIEQAQHCLEFVFATHAWGDFYQHVVELQVVSTKTLGEEKSHVGHDHGPGHAHQHGSPAAGNRKTRAVWWGAVSLGTDHENPAGNGASDGDVLHVVYQMVGALMAHLGEEGEWKAPVSTSR